jgi:hypothetical protein
MIKKLLFAMVIAAVAGNAYAETTTQTVTTQNYVDTRVETKQDKIASHPTGRYPNSVITDTTTDGVIEKRLVLAPGNGFRGSETLMKDYLWHGMLVDSLKSQAESAGLTEEDLKNGVISAGLIDAAFKDQLEMIWARQKNKVCVRYIDGAEETSENCLLWNLPDD